jgi:hypothetical protein
MAFWSYRLVPIFSVQLYIPVVSARLHSLVIQFDLRPIYFALILRMPPPTNFIPTPPISQDDELVERLQVLEHSRQRLVERTEQQSRRVKALENVLAERPQFVRQEDGPKSPRNLAAEIEKQREKAQALEQRIAESRQLEERRLTRETVEKEEQRKRRSTEVSNRRESVRQRRRALAIQQDEQRRRDRQDRILILEEQQRRFSTLAFKVRIYYTSLKGRRWNRIAAQSLKRWNKAGYNRS